MMVVVVLVVLARDDQSQPAGMPHVRWDGFALHDAHQFLNDAMALENLHSNFVSFLMF